MINIKSWANQNGKKRYREKNKTPASKNKTKNHKNSKNKILFHIIWEKT